jgi:hypothetical protein
MHLIQTRSVYSDQSIFVTAHFYSLPLTVGLCSVESHHQYSQLQLFLHVLLVNGIFLNTRHCCCAT